MKVSVSWLKDFLGDGAWSSDIEKVSDTLVMNGLEVEDIENLAENLDGVVVGHLLSVDKHPDADRLTLCQVNDGKTNYPVVCGAKNHKVGDKVLLAKVGTVLPGNFKIKKSKIRGVESEGMLCSAGELGLPEEYADGDGIIILDKKADVGASAAVALGLDDTVFELSVTANRGDCLSHIGVAREVALGFGISKLKEVRPGALVKEDPSLLISRTATVINQSADLCYDYQCRVMVGVKVGPSPAWLQNKLLRIGLRPINNVVDITNYVLMELGQPMHAFDFDLLTPIREGSDQRQIVVRQAKDGEKFLALNDEEVELDSKDLVITDGKVPVALAGVMGGKDTSVTETTQRILLESAHFNPISVRKSSKRHTISSDSSYRFERGVDPEGVRRALDLAARLILQVGGGKVVSSIARATGNSPTRNNRILLELSKVRDLLGVKISSDEIVDILRRLGAEVSPTGGNGQESLHVIAPSWRWDLTRDVDLIEEVARIYGYEKIPETLPPIKERKKTKLIQEAENNFDNSMNARKVLADLGFREVVQFAFTNSQDFEKLNISTDHLTKLENPISDDLSVMKNTLFVGLINNYILNKNRTFHGMEQFKNFELRKVFQASSKSETGVREIKSLGVLASGLRDPQDWSGNKRPMDFFDLKGDFELFLERFGISNRLISSLEYSGANISEPFHPGMSAMVSTKDGRTIGILGKLHPQVLEAFDVDSENIYFGEFNFDLLSELKSNPKFNAFSGFPTIKRDLAVLIDRRLNASELLETIKKSSGGLLVNVEVFDCFQGEGIPEDKKSLAVSLVFQHTERTLKDEEVVEAFNRVMGALQENHGAEQR
jgi:phenylalanyl-tRNA synthetase beta chain